jgi:carbonic anhydrase
MSIAGLLNTAIDNVELGNITSLLQKIKPAIGDLKDFKGEKKSKNPQFVEAVCDENVKLAIANIRTESPILKQMESDGEIMIVGAVYDMKTGKVQFFDK